MDVSCIGDTALASRLHEFLPRERFRLRAYLGASSRLRSSPLLDEVIELGSGRRPRPEELAAAAESGLLQPDDWMIHGTDAGLRAIANSALPESDRVALLPITASTGLEMMGNKAGLSSLCVDLDIAHPHSEIATSPGSLSQLLKTRTTPAMIKGSFSAGGHQVVRWEAEGSPDQLGVGENWYPLVVQDVLDGQLVSIEALFREGELTKWLYSVTTGLMSAYGQSTVRQFRRVPDSEALEALRTLGQAAGLHGFANCSLIREESTGRHYLFELDMRPNRWHQFGPSFGVDWARGMEGGHASVVNRSAVEELTSTNASSAIYLYPRHVTHAIRERSVTGLLPWIRRDPGTWATRQRGDRAVNQLEWREVVSALLRALGLSWLLPQH